MRSLNTEKSDENRKTKKFFFPGDGSSYSRVFGVVGG